MYSNIKQQKFNILEIFEVFKNPKKWVQKEKSGHHLVYLIINLFTPEKLVYSVFNTLHVSYHVPDCDNRIFLCDPFALKIG
jgi:hypothetical protein